MPEILGDFTGTAIATASKVGLVKPGTNLTVATDGTLNAAGSGGGGGFTLTTRLATPSSSTRGQCYLVDKGGTATDELYVGVEVAGSGYRWLRLSDQKLFSTVKPSSQTLNTSSAYAANLRCFLPMNEGSGTTVHDVSGNALNATILSSLWNSDTDGPSVNTTTANGITLPLNVLNAASTITLAVRCDFLTAQTSVAALYGFQKDTSNRFCFFPARNDISSSNYNLIVQDTAHGRVDDETAPGYATGSHDIALVMNGTNVKVYVDGAFTATTTTAVTPATIGTLTTATLGSALSGSWNALAGAYSCFAVWTTAYSLSQLQGFFANPYALLS